MEKLMKLCKDGDLETLIKEYYPGTEISGWSIMYIACQEGQLDICKWIFEEYPKELYKKSHHSYPVHGFCYNLLYFVINYVKNPCNLIAKFVIFCYIFTKNITKYHKFSYRST